MKMTKKNGKQPLKKINLIGCDTIVNSPSLHSWHFQNCHCSLPKTYKVSDIEMGNGMHSKSVCCEYL